MIKVILLLTFFLSFAQANETAYDVEKKINLNLDNIAYLNLEKTQLEEKIKDLQTLIKEKKGALLKRAKALSYLRKYQWGTLLNQVEDPTQLDRNLKIFDQMSQFDLNLFKEYRTSLKLLGLSRAELKQTIDSISQSVTDLKQQQIELAQKEALHLAEKVEKKVSTFLKFKGSLTRPLEGLLIWSYGSLPDKLNQYIFTSKGLLFKAQPKAAIRSVGPGVIIFSDVVPHWRETLIIQHDDHYYSVYAGLKEGPKKLKDAVEKNEIIGEALSEEFYFELRHFDNPINPISWFKESL